jgi:hypothetical protein
MAPEFLLPLALMALGYTALLAWFSLRNTEADLAALKARRQAGRTPATVTLETIER